MSLNDDKLIEAAVEKAVKKTFAILGVDVDKPESVEAFREDLRFGKSMRRYASHGFMAFIAVLFAAIAGSLWYGIVHKIKS
jgi:hypothetical protein